VEFALVFPLFLLMVISIFDFGRVVWARNSIENASREAARYAIVHGGTETTICPVGPDELGRNGTCPGGSPDATNAKQVARDWAIAAGDNLTVAICYGAGCAGDTSLTTNRPGSPVTVTVTSTVPLVVVNLFRMFGLDFGVYSLTSSVTMIVNT